MSNYNNLVDEYYAIFDGFVPKNQQMAKGLLEMGRPDIRTSIPQNVAEFYKNDVMPRLLSDSESAPLADRLTQVLDGSTSVYYGYIGPVATGSYESHPDEIKISRRNLTFSNHDETLAHEIHHAFRDGSKTGAGTA